MFKIIFLLVVIGILITPAFADPDNSKKTQSEKFENKQDKKNMEKKLENKSSKKQESKEFKKDNFANGFRAFGQDVENTLSDIGKAGKEFYEINIGELIYNEISSLEQKFSTIDNNKIRQDFTIQTQRAVDTILGEGTFEERISNVNSILSNLINSIQNKTTDNELNATLGQELIEDTTKIVEESKKHSKKTLILPKTYSSKSNSDKKWYSISMSSYEADVLAKKLKHLGFGLTATFVETKGEAKQAVRLTPPEMSEIKPDEITISGQKICREGLELVFKSTNGSQACVKPKTMDKLMARGWAISY